MRFVIIGGDAAGMSAASRAKRHQPDLKVVVFEQSGDVSYSACNMPYNIADPKRDMADLVVRSAEAFRAQGIDLRTGYRVERINRTERWVAGSTTDGTPFKEFYDHLLIATGASASRPDIPGIDQEGVFVLKTLAQGRMIKEHLRTSQVHRAVIIGMGYIALEMCEALHARGIEVEMVKPRAGLLPWLTPELSAMVRSHLEERGIRLHDGYPIDRIEAGPTGLAAQTAEFALEGQLVLVATGVTPNASLAKDAGLPLSVGGSIAVDRHLRTSDPAVLAAGDCADSYHVVTGEKTWIPLALRANRSGWAAADNVCGRPVAVPGVAGTAVFKVFAMQVARTGLCSRQAQKAGFDPVKVTISSRSRAHTYPGGQKILVALTADRKSGRLLGAQMVGTDQVAHRINAAAVALQAGMDVAALQSCDLAYAPPFGPTWDPLLVAANQLSKKL